MNILARIFPNSFDNNYGGSRIALWLFVPVALLRGVIGFNSFFFARSTAMRADGIPLDHYTQDAAAMTVSLFAHLGYFNMLIVAVCIVALIRYRAMIPFLFLVLLVLQLGGRATAILYPTVEAATASAQTGSAVVLGLLALNVVGFALSLVARKTTRHSAEGAHA